MYVFLVVVTVGRERFSEPVRFDLLCRRGFTYYTIILYYDTKRNWPTRGGCIYIYILNKVMYSCVQQYIIIYVHNIHNMYHAKSLKITRVATIDQAAAFLASTIEWRRRTLTSVTSAFNWRTLLTVRARTHTRTNTSEVYQNAYYIYTPTRHTSIGRGYRGGHELITIAVVVTSYYTWYL